MCQSPVVRSLILLDADNFEPVVFAAPQPVAVLFWGPDCGPCHVLAPTLERAVDAYGDRVTFAALDTAVAPQVAARFGVRAIPHLLFSARGEVCCHFLGVIPWAFMRDKLEHALTLSTRRFAPQQHL